jgi:hypothetical protein
MTNPEPRTADARQTPPGGGDLVGEPSEMATHLTDLERRFDPAGARPYEPQELIRFALRTGAYWASLALDWLDAGAPATGLQFALDDAGHDPGLPQIVRDRALRLMKNIRPYVWTAWLRDDAQKPDVQETVDRLVGHAITGCRYVEIDYAGGQEGWRGANGDVLDYGLELDLGNGETWSMIWEQTGCNEGLNVRPGRLVPESVRADGSAVRDVSDRWLELGPGTLTEVQLEWDDLSLGTIQLVGDNGRTTVITLYGSDEVRVYFSVASARDAGVR